MTLQKTDLTTPIGQSYRKILPRNWQKELQVIVEQNLNVDVYVLQKNNVTIGGMIATTKYIPEEVQQDDWAKDQIKNRHVYLGFLYITKNMRGKGYAKTILQQCAACYTKQNCWLMCKKSLVLLYESCGFQFCTKIRNGRTFDYCLIKIAR